MQKGFLCMRTGRRRRSRRSPRCGLRRGCGCRPLLRRHDTARRDDSRHADRQSRGQDDYQTEKK